MLQVAPGNIAAIWPLTYHLTSHANKMNKICGSLLEKKYERTHKQHLLTDPDTWTRQCWPTSKDLFTKLSMDTGYSQEDFIRSDR